MASSKNAFHIGDGQSETLHHAAYAGNKAMCIMRLNQKHTKVTSRDEDGRTRTYFTLTTIKDAIHTMQNTMSNIII